MSIGGIGGEPPGKYKRSKVSRQRDNPYDVTSAESNLKPQNRPQVVTPWLTQLLASMVMLLGVFIYIAVWAGYSISEKYGINALLVQYSVVIVIGLFLAVFWGQRTKHRPVTQRPVSQVSIVIFWLMLAVGMILSPLFLSFIVRR